MAPDRTFAIHRLPDDPPHHYQRAVEPDLHMLFDNICFAFAKIDLVDEFAYRQE